MTDRKYNSVSQGVRSDPAGSIGVCRESKLPSLHIACHASKASLLEDGGSPEAMALWIGVIGVEG